MTARWPYPVRLLALAAAALVIAPASEAAVAPRVHTVIIDKLKSARCRITFDRETRSSGSTGTCSSTPPRATKRLNVQLAPGTSGRTLIKHPGTIAFYCIDHPGMTGSLVVARGGIADVLEWKTGPRANGRALFHVGLI